MPKKKAVPEPSPEREMEPVSAAEAVEAPSAASAGMVEDAAVTLIEEGAPKPDDPVTVPEDPPADGQDMALELEAEDEAASEILGLEPGPSPDSADGIGGILPMPEGLAGISWPDAAGDMPADIPEWEQSPFPGPGQSLDGAVSEADDISPPAVGLADDPADGPDGVKVPDRKSVV